jgi:hypothetical protein
LYTVDIMDIRTGEGHMVERKKVAVGLRLYPEVVERLRNAIWWIGRGLTVNGVIEDATLKALEALEAEHNYGQPFPPRKGEVPKSKRS